MRRRLVGVILAIVVVAIAIWWWQHGGDAEPPKDSPAATKLHRAFDPAHPELTKLAWLGQRGVNDRDVAGIVIGDSGPIAGATVRLATRFSTAGALKERRVTTDASGAFDFGPQLAGWYVVLADAPKLTSTSQWIDVRNPEQPTDRLVLVLHPCDATIHGVVRDTGGGVVANARISREIGIATGLVAEADAQGNYDMCVPIGDINVVARADGYALVADGLYAIGRVRHDFALGPEATIAGKVERAGDHAPVANAVLELHGATQRVEFASSDALGHFTFAGITPGRYGITATAEELASARPTDAVAMVGGANEVTVELAPSFAIAGKVVETGTTKPIAGATVRMGSKLWIDRRNMEAITQADGSFSIEHVLPGEYTPSVNNAKIEKPITIAKADATGIVLEAERRATIAGRITRSGKPVDGADVMLKDSSYRTTSDAEGRYTLRDIKPGTVKLYAESHRLGAFSDGPELTLAAGDSKTGADVELGLAGAIAGKVVDQHDQPVSGVFVTFSLLHGRDFGRATTGEDGSFDIRALAGGGDYIYQVRPTANSQIIYKPASGDRFPPISLADGNTRKDGLVLKVQIDRLSITGRVVDPAGKPIADVAVRAVPAGKNDYSTPAATTDASGAFTIPNLIAGDYDVSAHGVDGDAREAAVAAGRSGLELRFTGLGSIDGTFTGFTDTPEIVAFRSDANAQFPLIAAITGTTFKIDHVPAGEYRLVARSKSGTDGAQLTVAAGAPTKVALKQRGTGAVTATIRDATTHAPIANATCGVYPMESYSRGTDRIPPSSSDASGAVRFEKVTEGKISISCSTSTTYAYAITTVAANDTAHVDLDATAMPTTPPVHRHAGLELEYQLGEIMVKSVEKGGAAEQAGILVGDIVQKIDGAAIPARYALNEIEDEDHPKLTIERGGKQLLITLSLATSP